MPYRNSQDHPFFEQIKRLSGDTSENRDAMYAQAAVDMASYGPAERVQMLTLLEQKLDEDTSPLRQHVQLENLRRSMANAHEALLRAKR